MDIAAFALAATATTILAKKKSKSKTRSLLDASNAWDDDDDDDGTAALFYVSSDNEPLLGDEDDDAKKKNATTDRWYRSTYVLVMHDPPDMFYEPKEWSHTTVLLCQMMRDDATSPDNVDGKLALPNATLRPGESHVACGQRMLQAMVGVDVTLPENCLHSLFTYPYHADDDATKKQWSDFAECVFRGNVCNLKNSGRGLVRLSLQELKEKVTESPDAFEAESYRAIRLYFQRQMDLRAKRRLLKGYSSIDMEKYGLRNNSGEQQQAPIVFRADEEDSERGDALDFTMKTDDGMSPRLLLQADVVLLGVSRAGKTPLSLLLSQTKGIKVANIPLLLEIPPPRQLFSVDARRVFLITQQAEHLQHVRRERLRRELKKRVGQRSTYADPDYVRRDLDNAKDLAREHGYTIVDITDRAMEEAASLIMSKLKERFPDKDFGDTKM